MEIQGSVVVAVLDNPGKRRLETRGSEKFENREILPAALNQPCRSLPVSTDYAGHNFSLIPELRGGLRRSVMQRI